MPEPQSIAAGLTLTVEGAVARLHLDRPDKRNALTEAMWAGLTRAVEQAVRNDAVALLRIEGRGANFSGGADIGEFPEVYGAQERILRYNAAVKAGVTAIAACPKPVIAVIRGACVGGGVSIALACDLRYAAESARLAIVPARLGLIYNHGDTKRLVDTVGASRAKDLLFTGRTITAAEALAFGLVDHVAADDDLEELAASHITAMLSSSHASKRATKRMIGAIAAGADTETDALAQAFSQRFASEDFAEGYRAFLEKRPPRFTER